MRVFISELQYLSELYARLHGEFSEQSRGTGSGPADLSESVLRNRELLSRVEQMSARLTELAQEWKTFRERLDPAAREEVTRLAAEVNEQAVRLSEVCERRCRQLESGRNELQRVLEGVQAGTRYLASMKPGRTNYPKFLDSHC